VDDKSNYSNSDVDEDSSHSSNDSSEDESNSEEENVEDNDEEDDCVAAGGDSIVNNDDEEDEENTPFGLDLIVKVTHTSVAMRKSPVKSSVKVVPVERGIHRIISFIFFIFFILQPTLVLIVKSPIPTRKVSKGDQLLAALATANKVREAPTPLYIKK
jgi:hypothetical protein